MFFATDCCNLRSDTQCVASSSTVRVVLPMTMYFKPLPVSTDRRKMMCNPVQELRCRSCTQFAIDQRSRQNHFLPRCGDSTLLQRSEMLRCGYGSVPLRWIMQGCRRRGSKLGAKWSVGNLWRAVWDFFVTLISLFCVKFLRLGSVIYS